MPWNQWPHVRGIDGHMFMESMATCAWNTQSIAADAGYLVLVPLAAAACHSLGRHPLAGLAAGFSGVAAVFLVNAFVTPTDALLVEVTNDAIR